MNTKGLLNGHILDGTGRIIDDGFVIFDREGIKEVGETCEAPSDGSVEWMDVAGKWVLPGLIDGHMHVTSMPGMLDQVGHVRQNLLAVGKLEACLQWGTTTVANASGCAENMPLADCIDEGRLPRCSRLVVAGVVSATGGHVRGLCADGPWDVRRAVRDLVTSRVHVIKTCASGGFQWAHESLDHEDYSEEELRAAATQAHARHLRVHVHAHAQPGLGNAIRAGCDVILHGAMMEEDGVDLLAASDAWYMPTLHITSEQIWGSQQYPPHMRDRMKAAYPVHREAVRQALRRGVRIAVGTDGGPGSVMHELEELVLCGMSPADALIAATRNTADALGILEKTGTIEPGKCADLLVITVNPLEDISRLGSKEVIDTVFRDGIRCSASLPPC